MAPPHSQPQFSLFLALLLLTSHVRTQTVSIQSITAYLAQRSCVQECIIGHHGDGNPAVMWDPIGCSSPYQNACMCNTGRASVWTTALSDCVNTYCDSKTADLSAALSLYNGYCATKLALVTSAPTVSLASVSDYMVARGCVQGCMLSRPPNGDWNLAQNLQCGIGGIRTYDECFCRKDLATDANSILTSCVNEWCSGNADDVSSAVSLYSDYCVSARASATGGGGSASSPTGATQRSGSSNSLPSETGRPDGSDSNSNDNNSPTSDNGNSSTGGNGNSSTSGNSSGPSAGVIAGIAIGCTLGAAILGVLVFLVIRKPKPPQPGPYNAFIPSDSSKYDQISSSYELGASSPSTLVASPQPNSQTFTYMPPQQAYLSPQPQAYLSPQPVVIPRGHSPGLPSELASPRAVTELDSISQVAGPAIHNPETSSNHSRETTTQQRVDSFNAHLREGSGSRRPADLMSNTGTEMTGGDGLEIWSAPGHR